MLVASDSGFINQTIPIIFNNTTSLMAIILSGFFGGLFAGLFSDYFESKRIIRDKRTDKYYEHRNTIVQIEQELIPLRVNISRDLKSLSDAIISTNSLNIRFILRFYKLTLSTGLGLKLLNLEFINKYAQLFSNIESFNSDIEYISQTVSMFIEGQKIGKIDESLINTYKVFLPYLKDKCEEIDNQSLELLAMSQVAINKEEEKMKIKFIKSGNQIKYTFSKKSLSTKYNKIKYEEDGSKYPNEKPPKFISLYLDLKKVPV